MTGSVLADAIVRTNVPSVVLVRFSLGARVMVGQFRPRPRIDARDWRAIGTAASGTVWNYWSEKDFTLKFLYKTAEAGQEAVGCEGIPTRSPRIKNVNLSRLVPSHMSHVKNVALR